MSTLMKVVAAVLGILTVMGMLVLAGCDKASQPAQPAAVATAQPAGEEVKDFEGLADAKKYARSTGKKVYARDGITKETYNELEVQRMRENKKPYLTLAERDLRERAPYPYYVK